MKWPQNQPCYWRTGKKLNKRDATSPAEAVNASLSENISLFQSLQVMTDDAELSSTRDATSTSVGPGAPNADEICLKPQALGAAVGLAVLFYLALGFQTEFLYSYKQMGTTVNSNILTLALGPFSYFASR